MSSAELRLAWESSAIEDWGKAHQVPVFHVGVDPQLQFVKLSAIAMRKELQVYWPTAYKFQLA